MYTKLMTLDKNTVNRCYMYLRIRQYYQFCHFSNTIQQFCHFIDFLCTNTNTMNDHIIIPFIPIKSPNV